MLERGLAPQPCLPLAPVRDLVERALGEDMPWGDITTDSLVPRTVTGCGRFVSKSAGVVAGMDVVAVVLETVDRNLLFKPLVVDGGRVQANQLLAEVQGSARSILAAERTALNFLQRMSGIATATAAYVQRIEGTGARIVDTRKTAPGLRLLDKYAVSRGGGYNHRFSLSDAVLVKDNHLAATCSVGSFAAVEAMKKTLPHTVKVEIEVDGLDQIEPALQAGADIILLDNMTLDQMREAVGVVSRRAVLEASGRITLDNAREVAQTGVDLISVGALTHSVVALDISLEFSVDVAKQDNSTIPLTDIRQGTW